MEVRESAGVRTVVLSGPLRDVAPLLTAEPPKAQGTSINDPSFNVHEGGALTDHAKLSTFTQSFSSPVRRAPGKFGSAAPAGNTQAGSAASVASTSTAGGPSTRGSATTAVATAAAAAGRAAPRVCSALTASYQSPQLTLSGYSDGSVNLCFFHQPPARAEDGAPPGPMRASTQTLTPADVTGVPAVVFTGRSSARRGSLTRSAASSSARTSIVCSQSPVTALHCVPLLNTEQPQQPCYLLAVAYKDSVHLCQVRCEAAASVASQLAAALRGGGNELGYRGAHAYTTPRASVATEQLQHAVRAALPVSPSDDAALPGATPALPLAGQGGGGGGGGSSSTSSRAKQQQQQDQQLQQQLQLQQQQRSAINVYVDGLTLSRCRSYIAVSVALVQGDLGSPMPPRGGGGGLVLVYRVPLSLASVLPGKTATAALSSHGDGSASPPRRPSRCEDCLPLGDVLVSGQHLPRPWTTVRAQPSAATKGGGRLSALFSAGNATTPASAGGGDGGAASSGSAMGLLRAELGGNGCDSALAGWLSQSVSRALFLYENGLSSKATTLFVAWPNSHVYARLPLAKVPGGRPLLQRLSSTVTDACMSTPCLALGAPPVPQQGRPRSGGNRHQSQSSPASAPMSKEQSSKEGPPTARSTKGSGGRSSARQQQLSGSAGAKAAAYTAATTEYAMRTLCGAEGLSGVRYGWAPTTVQQAVGLSGGAEEGPFVVLGCEGGTIMVLDGQRLVAAASAVPPRSHLCATQLTTTTAVTAMDAALAADAVCVTVGVTLHFASAAAVHAVARLTIPVAGDNRRAGSRHEYLVGLPDAVGSVVAFPALPLALVVCASGDAASAASAPSSCGGAAFIGSDGAASEDGGGGVSTLLWDTGANRPLALLPASCNSVGPCSLSLDGSLVAFMRAIRGEGEWMCGDAAAFPPAAFAPAARSMSIGSGSATRRHSLRATDPATAMHARRVSRPSVASQQQQLLLLQLQQQQQQPQPQPPSTVLVPCVMPVLGLVQSVYPLLFSFLSSSLSTSGGSAVESLERLGAILRRLSTEERTKPSALRAVEQRAPHPTETHGAGDGIATIAGATGGERVRPRSLLTLAGRKPVSRHQPSLVM